MSEQYKKERDAFITVWAKLNVLAGVLDPTTPDHHFPKGRLFTARAMTLSALEVLETEATSLLEVEDAQDA